jgi:hypothetical protein
MLFLPFDETLTAPSAYTVSIPVSAVPGTPLVAARLTAITTARACNTNFLFISTFSLLYFGTIVAFGKDFYYLLSAFYHLRYKKTILGKIRRNAKNGCQEILIR